MWFFGASRIWTPDFATGSRWPRPILVEWPFRWNSFLHSSDEYKRPYSLSPVLALLLWACLEMGKRKMNWKTFTKIGPFHTNKQIHCKIFDLNLKLSNKTSKKIKKMVMMSYIMSHKRAIKQFSIISSTQLSRMVLMENDPIMLVFATIWFIFDYSWS